MNEEAPAPPSPCTAICFIGEDGFCDGCGRSLDEIARWPSASAAAKRAILHRIDARRRMAEADGGGGSKSGGRPRQEGANLGGVNA